MSAALTALKTTVKAMAEVSTEPRSPSFEIDRVWLIVLGLPLLLALFDKAQALETVRFAAGAFGHTAIFITFAVLAVGYLKATGAETLLARAFEGREIRMIFLAAMLGGLSPFCSCEVIPFISALLAVGAPLSAVMALWLSSPLMDPAMFLITAGTLGTDFAVAKTLFAVSLGLLGGGVVYAFKTTSIFSDPLKSSPKTVCGACGPDKPFQGKPKWAFWAEAERVRTFRKTIVDNALFLGKWLLLAYMVEALMLAYIPAELIATVLGGDGVQPILLGAFVGAPAYLNGYAAVPLIDALLAQGMAAGAAMSFVIAGGVSSIPAAIAVWALVKTRVFAAYLSIGITGAIMAGLVWGAVA